MRRYSRESKEVSLRVCHDQFQMEIEELERKMNALMDESDACSMPIIALTT